MVMYKLIQKLEKLDYFNELLKNGIVPIYFIDYKVIYEYYLCELEILKKDKQIKNQKNQARFNTAHEFNISESSVSKIIKKMKS